MKPHSRIRAGSVRRLALAAITIAAGLRTFAAAEPLSLENQCGMTRPLTAADELAATAAEGPVRAPVAANGVSTLRSATLKKQNLLVCGAIIANRPARLEPAAVETPFEAPVTVPVHCVPEIPASALALADQWASDLLDHAEFPCDQAVNHMLGEAVHEGSILVSTSDEDAAESELAESEPAGPPAPDESAQPVIALAFAEVESMPGGEMGPPAPTDATGRDACMMWPPAPGTSLELPDALDVAVIAPDAVIAVPECVEPLPEIVLAIATEQGSLAEPDAPTKADAGASHPTSPLETHASIHEASLDEPSSSVGSTTAVKPEKPLEPSRRLLPAQDEVAPRRESAGYDGKPRDFHDFGFRMAYFDSKPIQPVSQQPPTAATPKPKAAGDVGRRHGISAMRDGGGNEPLHVLVGESARLTSGSPIERVELTNPEIAEMKVLSPHDVIVLGKTVGLTHVLVSSKDDKEDYEVAVSPNFRMLQSLIKAVAPRGDVQVSPLNGSVVLTGHVPDAESAERIGELAAASQGAKVINQLSVAGVQQTMLRVTVAEVNKEAMRALGVNWAVGASTLSRDFFLGNNLGQINPTNFSSNGLPNVLQGQQTYSVAPTGTSPLTNLTIGFPRAELQYFLNALRENNLARTLAEPNLVAISGQTAMFLAGGEVPIPVSQGGSVAGAITVQYKEFGVRLGFTPTVLAGQIVRLHVMSEVSDVVDQSREVGSVPLYSFRTRRVETTIECGNGQSFAIAGLLGEKVSAIASKLPGLGDMPILGALFSSVEYQQARTELIILVTPELVEPLDPNQVPQPPGAEMVAPSDFELFGLGRLEGQSAAKPAESGDAVHTLPERPASPSPAGGVAQVRGPWGMEDELALPMPARQGR